MYTGYGSATLPEARLVQDPGELCRARAKVEGGGTAFLNLCSLHGIHDLESETLGTSSFNSRKNLAAILFTYTL